MKLYKNPAVVLGQSETGLAICRSLGKKGIEIFGISYRKEIGLYSKFTSGKILPHPEDHEIFLHELEILINCFNEKPVLFIADDNYLPVYINNCDFFDKHFLHNLPSADLMEEIQDKYSQYILAKKHSVNVPKTIFADSLEKVKKEIANLEFPVIIKARDVNDWRKKIGHTKKCFNSENKTELFQIVDKILDKNVSVIIQEKILSTDQENFLVSVFIDKNYNIKLLFTLRKIHQFPIHFGVGTSTISVKNSELEQIGIHLFKSIKYKGIGSAEFKFDYRDNNYKLIEINTRYWQQNSLAEKCGMNFPLMDYLEATDQNPDTIKDHQINIKWISLLIEMQHIYTAIKAGNFSFTKWYKRIKNFHITSIYQKHDLMPFIYHFYLILIKVFKLIHKNIFQNSFYDPRPMENCLY